MVKVGSIPAIWLPWMKMVIRIVGRKKEMIIRGGYKIYPREVEEVLYTCPVVQEAAVIGLPDPVLGEVNCACIKLKENSLTTAEEIVDFCQGKLADYKIPDKVLFMEALPFAHFLVDTRCKQSL